MLIDQFMLANPQFIEKMTKVVDEETTVKNDIIREYGGKVDELPSYDSFEPPPDDF